MGSDKERIHPPVRYNTTILKKQEGLLLIQVGKGNKVRSVPLNSSARDAIATSVAPRLQVENPSIKAVAKSWPKSTSPESFLPLFESQKGGGLTTSAKGQMLG
jgi:site-specific recombinase XerC